jgi:hypothetical protein
MSLGTPLSAEAREILKAAANATDSGKGSIVIASTPFGIALIIGGGDLMIDNHDKQVQERYRDALFELVARGLIREDDDYTVTTEGYRIASSL